MNDEDILGTEMYEYHNIDNPGAAAHRTLFSHLEYLSEQFYGNPGSDTNRRIRQMEYLQYEFVRLAMEGSRRRMFSSSGIQFWMYNDCWPALGWSLIDYWGGRKAGWYGFAAGSRPVIAASEQTDKTVNWWISNDLLEDIDAKVRVFIQPVIGKAFDMKNLNLKLKANESTKIMELDLAELKSKLANNAILVGEVETAKGTDRSYWTPARPQDVKYEPISLKVSQKQTYDSGSITVSTDKWAHVVTLEGDVEFEDNYFELLPGETRIIKWKARSIPFAEEIKVSCWNCLK
jgi:beta-mannosidase